LFPAKPHLALSEHLSRKVPSHQMLAKLSLLDNLNMQSLQR